MALAAKGRVGVFLGEIRTKITVIKAVERLSLTNLTTDNLNKEF